MKTRARGRRGPCKLVKLSDQAAPLRVVGENKRIGPFMAVLHYVGKPPRPCETEKQPAGWANFVFSPARGPNISQIE